METLLIGIGAVGIMGMSFLFPALGVVLAKNRKLPSAPADQAPTGSALSLAVLIPAHNEEATLPATLKNLQAALNTLQSALPEFRYLIRVGADRCQDQTAQLARDAGAEAIEFPSNGSKWKTLGDLLETTPAEYTWVALVDAGALWPEELLKWLEPLLRSREVMGIAPAYHPRGSGALEAIHWGLERGFKAQESAAGGPVSVHGASVLYRREELREALRFLSSTGESQWLNDDVAIPLTLRLLHPEKRIHYWVGADASQRISDLGLKTSGPELSRRRRMVVGNLQWMRVLLSTAFEKNPIAGLLALRRVFRVLWAYWGAALYLGLSLALSASTPAFLALLILGGLVVAAAGRRPREALFASWMTPFELWIRKDAGRTRWV